MVFMVEIHPFIAAMLLIIAPMKPCIAAMDQSTAVARACTGDGMSCVVSFKVVTVAMDPFTFAAEY